MKTYVVMTNYGVEGWKIAGETDDFQEAVKLREAALGYGEEDVVMFKPVKIKYTELVEDDK